MATEPHAPLDLNQHFVGASYHRRVTREEEDFAARVREFLIQAGSVSGLEGPAGQSVAMVDADEPAEALSSLAWAVVRGDLKVPGWLVQRHGSLTGELTSLGPVTPRFPSSLPAHIQGAESPGDLEDPGGRRGQLIALDTDERIPISSRLHYWGFKSWFWSQVNDSLELLLDEYEGEVVPASQVLPFAGHLTAAKSRAGFPPALAEEVDRLVSFLQTAAAHGSEVEVDL